MSQPTIPTGMKAWHGGTEAPADWDGGPYLCRDGKMYVMRGYGWGHGTNCWNATAEWDRIAYTPVAAAREQAMNVQATPANLTASLPRPEGPF